MALNQIVVYNKITGEVLIAGYKSPITKRYTLKRLTGLDDITDIAFYWEEANLIVKPHLHRVKHVARGMPPILVDENNQPIAFTQFRNNQLESIKTASSIKVDCEYGMGDQIIALEALHQFTLNFPDKILTFGVHPDYQQILSFATPRPTFEKEGRPPPSKEWFYILLNPNHFLWDPRGGQFGKKDFYGQFLGLERVDTTVDLAMTPSQIDYWLYRANLRYEAIQLPLLVLHFFSASRTASRYPESRAKPIIDFWLSNTNGSVFLCGDPLRWIDPPEKTFTIPHRSDWASTAALICLSTTGVYCDSGPMHIARAAKRPGIRLWGGSGPLDILGKPPSSIDIRGKTDCIDELCPACRYGDPRCMNSITTDEIISKLTQQLNT